MTRASVAVRDATPDDLVDLVVLWTELRELTSRSERAAPAPTDEEVLARLGEAQKDPPTRLVVAVRDDTVAGMAVFVAGPLTPLMSGLAVHIHYLQVRAGMRRRGIGRALVAAATVYAEECGADHVVAAVPPGLRDAHRFYARLGLAPLVVRRAVAVTALRRRLAAEARAGLPDVIARRRSLRARVQRSTEPALESVFEPAFEPALESAFEPPLEPVSTAAPQPAVEPALESALEPALKPALRPALRPAL